MGIYNKPYLLYLSIPNLRFNTEINLKYFLFENLCLLKKINVQKLILTLRFNIRLDELTFWYHYYIQCHIMTHAEDNSSFLNKYLMKIFERIFALFLCAYIL